jgi:hypothetical protein
MPLKPHPTDPDKLVYVPRQYDLPTKREWVGLTDEDCKGMNVGDMMIAMWADRVLKEKNT